MIGWFEKNHPDEEYEVLDNLSINMPYITWGDQYPQSEAKRLFAKSIELFADTDMILFCKNYRKSTGCRCERAIALNFGIPHEITDVVDLPEKYSYEE